MLLAVEASEVGATRMGHRITIPDNDRARLMYYLRCFLRCMPQLKEIFFDFNLDSLSNYSDFSLSTPEDVQKLLTFCAALNPQDNGMPVVCVPERHALLGKANNEFYEVSDRSLTSVLETMTGVAVVMGKEIKISQVLVASHMWIDKNYVRPMQKLCAEKNIGESGESEREQKGAQRIELPSLDLPSSAGDISHEIPVLRRPSKWLLFSNAPPFFFLCVGVVVQWMDAGNCACSLWSCCHSWFIAWKFVQLFAFLSFFLGCFEMFGRVAQWASGSQRNWKKTLCIDVLGLVSVLCCWFVLALWIQGSVFTAGFAAFLVGGLLFFIVSLWGNSRMLAT